MLTISEFKVNRTFILTGCLEYFTFLCVYDMMRMFLLELNCQMLMKLLSEQFLRYCSCSYFLVSETTDVNITGSVMHTSLRVLNITVHILLT